MKNPENLYLRGSTWYYRFNLNGQRYRGSCDTHNVLAAKKVLREKMNEAEASPGVRTVGAIKHLTVAQACEFDARRARDAGSSEYVISTTIREFWKRLGARFEHVGEFTRDSLSLYVDAMLEAGFKPQTIKRDLWAARRAYEYAQGLDSALPPLGKLRELKSAPKGKNKGVPVTLDDVKRFLSQLKGPARDHAVILLMTGLRATEFSRLESAWLTTEYVHELGRPGWFVALPEGMTKNGQPRRVGICLPLKKLIQRNLPATVNYRKAWETAARRAGLSKAVSPRDLRHTFASMLAHVDYYGVDLVMGHAAGAAGMSSHHYQHADSARLTRLADAAAERFKECLLLCL